VPVSCEVTVMGAVGKLTYLVPVSCEVTVMGAVGPVTAVLDAVVT